MLGSNCILERYPWEQFIFPSSMSKHLSKDFIRQKIKAQRKKMSEQESYEAGERALHLLTPFLNRFKTWLLYSPIQNEISTLPLFNALIAKGHTVGFARVENEGLSFHEVKALHEKEIGRFSLEPKASAPKISALASAAIIVPGLAFSRFGHRLGFGKGFYDRTLHRLPHLMRLGFAYDFQVLMDEFEVEAHDEKMDFVVSPSGLWGSPRVCG